jgi:hypothetical protein
MGDPYRKVTRITYVVHRMRSNDGLWTVVIYTERLASITEPPGTNDFKEGVAGAVGEN